MKEYNQSLGIQHNFYWFMERVSLHVEEKRLFKSIVREHVDEDTWQSICDEYNQKLQKLRHTE